MAAQSLERKFSEQMDKALNSFSFQPNLFAFFMTSKHIKVQTAVFNCLMACIDVWAEKYDKGNWDTDEGLALFARAKRVQESLSPYQTDEDEV